MRDCLCWYSVVFTLMGIHHFLHCLSLTCYIYRACRAGSEDERNRFNVSSKYENFSRECRTAFSSEPINSWSEVSTAVTVTSCSPMEVHRRFGGTYCFYLQCRTSGLATFCWLFSRLTRPWRWRRYIIPWRRWIYTRLHGVTSQNLLPTKTVRTFSNVRKSVCFIWALKQNHLDNYVNIAAVTGHSWWGRGVVASLSSLGWYWEWVLNWTTEESDFHFRNGHEFFSVSYSVDRCAR
jgi:hypothetical protein